jgi:hypothetical protein
MKRGTAVLVACLAGAAALAPAAEARVREARFVAYVSGKQETTWKLPRTNTYLNCQGQRWEEGEGSETVRFRSKPMRVLVYMNGRYGPFVRYGTWSLNTVPKRTSLEGKGTITRTGRHTGGIEPGWCFSLPTTREDFGAPYDCGTQKWEPDVQLRWERDKVTVSAAREFVPIQGTGFETCPLFRTAEAGLADFVDVAQRYPRKDVFDPSQGLVEVLGRKTFSGQVGKHPVFGPGSTTVTWKLRLRRAR